MIRVPGLPVVANLLQLKEKKLYNTFTRWAEEYGPIYSIRTGASTLVILNSADVGKENVEPLCKFSCKRAVNMENLIKLSNVMVKHSTGPNQGSYFRLYEYFFQIPTAYFSALRELHFHNQATSCFIGICSAIWFYIQKKNIGYSHVGLSYETAVAGHHWRIITSAFSHISMKAMSKLVKNDSSVHQVLDYFQHFRGWFDIPLFVRSPRRSLTLL